MTNKEPSRHLGICIGDQIGGRFELLERVGEGAFSIVFKARDVYLNEHVAVKIFHEQVEPNIPWREASALSLLNAPGTTTLIEEGSHAGFDYLVIDYIEGKPFPGIKHPCPWSALAPLLERLLETLAHVHQQGIVHRDIKPENVLVKSNGEVKLLDFNLSYNHRIQWKSLQRAAFYGTIAYIAPEQIRNGPTTARTDLYAVGVMIFEALTGELPFKGESYQHQIRNILMGSRPDLLTRCPELSPEIVALVMRLIARDPAHRPTSARAVIRVLQNDLGVASSQDGFFPLIDKHAAACSAALRAARAGCSFDIIGEPESGKSLVLASIERSLQTTSGLKVLRLEGAVSLTEPTKKPLDVLLYDNADRAAPENQAILSTLRDSGCCVIRTMRTTSAKERETQKIEYVCLDRVPARSLELLFKGPERVFHLKSQPAHILFARTGGLYGRVQTEIMSWVRLGLASWEGSALIITTESVAHLQAGFGRNELPPSSTAQQHKSTGVSHDMHRSQAQSLPLDDPMRIFHWSLFMEREQFLTEIATTAHALDERGFIKLAIACLREGVRVANKTPRLNGACKTLLIQWIKIALSTTTPREIETVLHALTRTPGAFDDSEYVALTKFLRQARHASIKFGHECANALAALKPFEEEELELRRAMYRIRVSWSRPQKEVESVLEEIGAWVRESSLPEARASLIGWRGILKVRQGQFNEAAELHMQAAGLHRRRSAVISSMLNSASAHLDGLSYEAAARIAKRAKGLALMCRHQMYEARADYLTRAARYRLGQTLDPDPDILYAAVRLNAPWLEGLVYFLEAVIAWRQNIPAFELAAHARRLWLSTGNRWGELLAAALEVMTSEETINASVIVELAIRARSCPLHRISVQVLGMLLLSAPSLREQILRELDPLQLIDKIPRRHWYSRLEVMSIAEVLDAYHKTSGAERYASQPNFSAEDLRDGDDPAVPDKHTGDVIVADHE